MSQDLETPQKAIATANIGQLNIFVAPPYSDHKSVLILPADARAATIILSSLHALGIKHPPAEKGTIVLNSADIQDFAKAGVDHPAINAFRGGPPEKERVPAALTAGRG